MSVEKIIAHAMENNPLKVKETFAEEMTSRITMALEEKYKKTSGKMSEEEGEKEVCSHCEGKGYHMDGEKKVECPDCDGTGYKKDEMSEEKDMDDDDMDDDDDDNDDADDDDSEEEKSDDEVKAEMKKMHREGKSKSYIMAKYDYMDKEKVEGLYASSCGGKR